MNYSVRVSPWGEDSVINTCYTVVIGAELNPDLLEFLLRANSNMQFGGFSLDTDGNILFEHSIVGSICDQNELEVSVLAVLEVADDYDDKIVERWGGKRGLDIPPQ
uniref:T3SS (YopN, CesT) and YbjN peptide-binding chaperone 1 n=1 Tax=Okeania sp. SIO2F4 TaxID=2607790 RepID=UPI0035C8ECDD